MVKAVSLYEQEPAADRYARHVEEFAEKVPGASFRHGKIFSPPGMEQRYRYFAEFEWPDMATFQQVVSSPEFAAAGKDAADMGIPFSVHFAELE